MTKRKWKKGFLSSSLPLEFEVAKILAHNYRVALEPDYSYERFDVTAGQSKEFSVDLHASLFFPTSNPHNMTATLELLIECKYRTPNIIWVFLPDINRPDLGLGSSPTIKAIDKFSFCRVPHDQLYDFDKNIFQCYKGMEVDLSNNTAYDSEIRHGIAQLQYALPRVILHEILVNIHGHTDDVVPFFILPILVTTAELRVLRRGTTLAKVEKTHILEDITEKAPYLTLFNLFGEDFIAHAKRQSS